MAESKTDIPDEIREIVRTLCGRPDGNTLVRARDALAGVLNNLSKVFETYGMADGAVRGSGLTYWTFRTPWNSAESAVFSVLLGDSGQVSTRGAHGGSVQMKPIDDWMKIEKEMVYDPVLDTWFGARIEDACGRFIRRESAELTLTRIIVAGLRPPKVSNADSFDKALQG